ncbi:EAL domain-containing protein [Vibrio sp. TH_r3]|uniref:bifunctional diguanylate cyclase/phosphodiesterase n=1 Tax=Vibrio sp. TH_r3 TaxID=3082084 RepID=UPI0029556FAE|nr:EAL domain-containing protein [Vibrio sp. TH_r3]MDV7104584.1 EAL domain-containing protein [Vibrio sp. TH_r3]
MNINVKNNIWMIYIMVFISSLIFFLGVNYYSWTSINKVVLNKQQTHVELLSNSVQAYLKSQDSLLEVLGIHLIMQHQIPNKPIHDTVLDHMMSTYPDFLGLGLAAYDGRALVVSSNFDLNKVPNLMELDQTKKSFSEARESRKIHTGPTYIIKALEKKSYAMPIRRAIYIPNDASQAIAVMTAGIKLDYTPIFSGHETESYHQIEIIRGDKYPVFSTDDNIEYTKPIPEDYYNALKNHIMGEQPFSIFYFSPRSSNDTFQIVSHYDSYLNFWFISKISKHYIFDSFINQFWFIFLTFIGYNIVLLSLTRSIANSQKERRQDLFKMAHHDILTGLPNRSLLLIKLQKILSDNSSSNNYHAILFLDIDNFKAINDTYGHEYGDDLLKQATSRIQRCIKTHNTVARFGGDEFVVLLPQLTNSYKEATAQAEQMAAKLLSVLSNTYGLGKYQYTCSASIGVVLFNDSSREKSDLLKQADIAMYKAKRSGKNSICFFDPNMQEKVTAIFELESELRLAITEEQLELFYQPQVNQLNKVVAAEALVRWRHPQKGVITPNSFISIAEKTGLILPLGKWVLKAACQQLCEWQMQPDKNHLSLSVNVSYKQFREPNFVSSVSDLVKRYKIQPGKLHLELTETMLVEEMDMTIRRMNELRKLNIHFSLDDFGTGYSSLRYLKKLPLSQLKIDKSFIDDLESNTSDQSIVKTIISMSKSLNLSTIAEGVETAQQRAFLETEGCLLYQGYFYSEPLPINEFDQFLMKH